MRVSLLVLRDLTWLAILVLSIGLTIAGLALTQPHGGQRQRDR
jgi:hypothetical protein